MNSTKVKQIIRQSDASRSGNISLSIPREWDETKITEVSYEVNHDMNYIDTVYYRGAVVYDGKAYPLSGAMCLDNKYPQTPGFYIPE